MLSLKASRADNFYYGSVEDEKSKKKKEKEIKKKNKKEYNEIKFEIPYTIICTKCDIYIYKGERFNSQRVKVGHYINTCLYSFSIFCKNCLNEIIIETNPQKCSYDIIEGARKKDENYKNILTHKGKNNVNTIDLEEIKKKKVDPFLLLEKKVLQNKSALLYDKNERSSISGESNEDGVLASTGAHISRKETEEGEVHHFNSTSRDENMSDENISDVIKETYKRNHMLKNDYLRNSNLRKHLRDIKNDKIRKKEDNKKKNIFINIISDPFEDVKAKKYILLNKKYRKNAKEKKRSLKNRLIKKSSIFDKKYLKGG